MVARLRRRRAVAGRRLTVHTLTRGHCPCECAGRADAAGPARTRCWAALCGPGLRKHGVQEPAPGTGGEPPQRACPAPLPLLRDASRRRALRHATWLARWWRLGDVKGKWRLRNAAQRTRAPPWPRQPGFRAHAAARHARAGWSGRGGGGGGAHGEHAAVTLAQQRFLRPLQLQKVKGASRAAALTARVTSPTTRTVP